MIKKFRSVVAKHGFFYKLPYQHPEYEDARLWRKVLDQAIHDLLTGGDLAEDVRDWLYTEDYYDVCMLAMVDHELATKMFNLIEKRIQRFTNDE